ncbi:hypothetical protein ACH5RR_002778 [Cinchona calisaya]|uniref:B3 domain-containing protein n=1 Tax=Cinchona calisaya TaxID=153742 RepID=A0ABD3ASX8_9GENT
MKKENHDNEDGPNPGEPLDDNKKLLEDEAKKKKQKISEESDQEVESQYKGLPIEFKNYIKGMMKKEYSVDTDDGILMIESLFQTAITICPTFTKVELKAKKKEKNKNSRLYVLRNSWNEVVARNNLEAGQIVQLWAVRVMGHWCFSLRRLIKAEEGNNDDATAKSSSSSSASSSSDS